MWTLNHCHGQNLNLKCKINRNARDKIYHIYTEYKIWLIDNVGRDLAFVIVVEGELDKKITNHDEVSNLCCLKDLLQEYISACDHHSYSTTAKEKTKLTDLLSQKIMKIRKELLKQQQDVLMLNILIGNYHLQLMPKRGEKFQR